MIASLNRSPSFHFSFSLHHRELSRPTRTVVFTGSGEIRGEVENYACIKKSGASQIDIFLSLLSVLESDHEDP